MRARKPCEKPLEARANKAKASIERRTRWAKREGARSSRRSAGVREDLDSLLAVRGVEEVVYSRLEIEKGNGEGSLIKTRNEALGAHLGIVGAVPRITACFHNSVENPSRHEPPSGQWWSNVNRPPDLPPMYPPHLHPDARTTDGY